MPWTANEQALYDHARFSLPRFLFQKADRADEVLGAYVKVFDEARRQTAEWLVTEAFIATASGIWLDQHARDRGTVRQDGETDATLRARLRTLEDQVTPDTLESGAAGIIGLDISDVYMVELRRDKAFMFGSGAGEAKAYLSRGYRMSTSGRPMTFIVILPYGTTEAQGAAVSEYLRSRKGAGYKHMVEIRQVP